MFNICCRCKLKEIYCTSANLLAGQISLHRKISLQAPSRGILQVTNNMHSEEEDGNVVFSKPVEPLTSCVLTKRSHVISAQNLLYKAYFEEAKWRWLPDNPTGFTLNDDGFIRYITDNFEDASFWVGVFHHDELISCIRTVFRTDDNPKLDIEGYEDSKKECIQTVLRNDNLVEMQRYYTKPGYRCASVNALIMNVVGRKLVSMGVDVIGTSHITFYSRFGITKIIDRNFDYGDGVNTNVMFASAENVKKCVQLTSKALQLHYK